MSECIDLGRGHPAPSLLPGGVLREAATHALAGDPELPLQYSPGAGLRSFRVALAAYLGAAYQREVEPDALFVTAGASHGLDLTLSRLTEPGDVVLVEEPTYFYALGIIAKRGLRAIPVPMDEGGLDVDALDALAAQHEPALLYTIPVFQNPTGATMAVERRRRVVEIATARGFRVVADEVYQLLHFDERPPPSLRAFDHGDRVVSLGSFSKIFGPGLRLGWAEGSDDLVAMLGDCGVRMSGGGVSPVTQAIVQHSLQTGRQAELVEQLSHAYAQRAEALCAALEQHLAGARFVRPKGGFFVWLELPPGITCGALAPAADAAGVGFRAGPLFSSSQEQTRFIRVGFSYYDAPELEEGVLRLARAVSSVERVRR